MRARIAEELHRRGLSMPPSKVVANLNTLLGMLDAGKAITLLPRFVAARVEIGARRNCESMGLALIELSNAWSVRERHILVRDHDKLPPYAQSLIDTLCAHYQEAP